MIRYDPEKCLLTRVVILNDKVLAGSDVVTEALEIESIMNVEGEIFSLCGNPSQRSQGTSIWISRLGEDSKATR